jgi:protein MpaA
LVFISALVLSSGALAEDSDQALVKKFMEELRDANQSRHWNPSIYTEDDWKVHGKSVDGRPLIYFDCGAGNKNTTLMLSSVHGDEVTPIYFGLRLVSWLKGEPDICKNYHVIVAPIVNPDGYLAKKETRTNKHGIDLNRNFPTKDFDQMALKLWKDKFKSDGRRFPGEKGGSEPETQFQMWLIEEFHPEKILTVHSPLNFFDYDGPESDELRTFTEEYVNSCKELRAAVKHAANDYNFLNYGFFPGSLGNYAGKERGIPTLTLELPTVDAAKAKSYFERLKKGTRELVLYTVKGERPDVSAYSKSGSEPK